MPPVPDYVQCEECGAWIVETLLKNHVCHPAKKKKWKEERTDEYINEIVDKEATVGGYRATGNTMPKEIAEWLEGKEAEFMKYEAEKYWNEPTEYPED